MHPPEMWLGKDPINSTRPSSRQTCPPLREPLDTNPQSRYDMADDTSAGISIPFRQPVVTIMKDQNLS